MLPIPPRSELAMRLPRLALGLIAFGVGIAMLVVSNLGLAPWEVLHQGLSFNTGIPIGRVGILTGAVVLLLWIPLRERLGIGTVANVLVIGLVIDITLHFAPETVAVVWQQWVLLLAGTAIVAIGSGLYIGAGLGPGPRDGLMTGLGKRRVPIGLARGVIEVSVLAIGWILGGTVGVGTVIFAFGVGPLVGWTLPFFSVDPVPGPDRTTVASTRPSH